MSTLGCKVNQYESQEVRELFESMGYRPARDGETADIAVVNTCAVTSEALRKSRQAIRRLASGGRTAVFVIGCGASMEAHSLRDIDGVAGVLGHDVESCRELRRLILARSSGASAEANPRATPPTTQSSQQPTEYTHEGSMKPASSTDAASRSSNSAHPQVIVGSALPIVNTGDSLDGRIERFDGHQRAFLKVQDGCDAFCTYCIIPRLRSRLAWKPVEHAVAEARRLVESGHKEIIVTGIFLGAYGRDTAVRKRFADGPTPLAKLIDALADVDGLERLRLSSLEPGDVDDALLNVLASKTTCVPHLHLPLQSGSQEVLRRMNRQYTRDAFLRMIERVQSALDRPAITTDIIVGFPGESDADFQASVDIARAVPFEKIHAFPFSPRAGTAAAKWQGSFVPKATTRERIDRLGEVERECSAIYRRQAVGLVERVLVERVEEASDERPQPASLCSGRSDRYFMVYFEAADVRPGDIVPVRIDRVTPTRTHGTLLPNGVGAQRLSFAARR